jgi:hypothetical protein
MKFFVPGKNIYVCKRLENLVELHKGHPKMTL